jgi:nitric-oxide synthase
VTTSTTGRTPDGGGWPDTEAEALALLSQLEAEAPDGVTSDRRNDVVKSIRSIGTYEQTAGELTWGARIAWRNAVDCVGRPYWRILTVRDERKADDPDDLFDTCIEHLRVATNGGHVRVVLTATAPASPGRPSWRLLNEQLVQYAGYRTADGFTGDRRNERLTQLAMSLGWSGAGTAFDVLPLVLHREGERPRWRSPMWDCAGTPTPRSATRSFGWGGCATRSRRSPAGTPAPRWAAGTSPTRTGTTCSR